MTSWRIPVAMTIAGSDSGGGAGVEADLKTFSALGVYGTVVITSVTAQNTREVRGVYDLPPDFVYLQIKTVVEDIRVDAAKTGMLSNPGIVGAVADAVGEFGIRLVVDPVMVAKSGARLLRDDALEALTRRLLPQALLVTPNASEAGVLAGFPVESVEDAKRAARAIHDKYGVPAVVVKGGHLKADRVVDVLFYEGDYYLYEAERIESGCLHGAGCSFSAAVTAFLARGLKLPEAVKMARGFMDYAIKYGVRVGGGHCPVNPMAYLEVPAYKYAAIENVRRAVEALLENQALVMPYAPEVGINVVEAPHPLYATSPGDVVGVEGRIVRAGGRLVKVGDVRTGASSHLARLVLALVKRGLKVRGAVNVRYGEDLVERARRAGLRVVFVDRRLEPPELKSREGGSMEWIAGLAGGEEPDLIYDVGDVGKEPMVRVLGEDAVDAVTKLLSILKTG
ncbi:phosphomethylpyrimidine kinase [Thermogladius calderae 1633]|uniref:Phosphomethylpyrimidine kinase n=1 Tax=Thermogladius calderae (strain DSM 22663 / VKM B-2946 / 1633) TaxID=1184251 RepID=I3TFA9_THEC1|nr:bifunctional hydroxymethylpyrimidine kinase/phosphomethylpyrimidine kinase [Thermogladius calderae]AFK51447.1 phosphomethylpyrimidine kinase [Thermogladius calderae 1633]